MQKTNPRQMILDEKRPEMQRERERDFCRRESVPTHLSIHSNRKENVGDDRIEENSVQDLGLVTFSEVEKSPSKNTMPPKDHFILLFDRESIKNLKERAYPNMKQYSYEQRGK